MTGKLAEYVTTEEKLSLTLSILNHINRTVHEISEFKNVVTEIKNYLNCDAVAIRITNGDDFPYYTSAGFSDEFIKHESSLIDDVTISDSCEQCDLRNSMSCLCGAVINDALIDTVMKSKNGSFLTGDVNRIEQGRVTDRLLRNFCGQSGYNSVLLIPLRMDNEIVGILQCNDTHKDFFSNGDLSFLEDLGDSIALAIFNNEELLTLRRESSLFKQAQKSAKIGSWVINLETNVVEFGEGISDLHDYPFEVNKSTLLEFIDERVLSDDKELMQKAMQALLNRENTSVDYRAQLSNGRVRYYRSVGTSVGKQMQGVTFDITDHKEAEIEAEQSRAFLESIVTGMNTAIIVINPQRNRVVESNTYAQNLFSLSEKELNAIRGTALLSVRYFKKPKSLGILSPDMESNEEALLKQPDGTLIPVQRIIMKTVLRNKMHYVVILFDISQHKQLEQQLAHSQKMESIGSLAAGVAHEINTPIQYIGDNTHFLQEGFNTIAEIINEYQSLFKCYREHPDLCVDLIEKVQRLEEDGDIDFLIEEIPEAIKQSIDGVNRVSTIVQAMKKFSHPGKTEMTLNNLNEIVNNTSIVARNEWKYVAELELNLSPDLPEIPIHSDDISQVILNLIINASHAINDTNKKGEKGKITVSTKFDENIVTIMVADTGAGISPDIYDKIFNPFFTTKEVGKGTGQGLAMAYSIITEKHKGSIYFQSELGSGTTFIIELPRG